MGKKIGNKMNKLIALLIVPFIFLSCTIPLRTPQQYKEDHVWCRDYSMYGKTLTEQDERYKNCLRWYGYKD